MKVDIYRKVETSEAITGEFWLDGVRECCYLEPSRHTPFYPGHPCIDAGTYRVVLTKSPHLGYICPEVLDVPGRTAIRWHIGNFPEDVLGCCVVGTAVGKNQVSNSKVAFDALMAKLTGQDTSAEYHDPPQVGTEIVDPILAGVESSEDIKPMPDQTPAPPPPPLAANPAPAKPPAGPTINIGEEFGTAKRNLPPASMLLIAIGVVLIVVAIASFVKRAKPQAGGSLDNVTAVEIPGQGSTMVALTFTLRNTSDKVLYVHTLQSSIKVPDADSTSEAVSAMDFERYFQAFPALKIGAQPALSPETKIQPNETVSRTIIAVFPITLDKFNQRQSTAVVIWAYDQTMPTVLSK